MWMFPPLFLLPFFSTELLHTPSAGFAALNTLERPGGFLFGLATPLSVLYRTSVFIVRQ